MNAPALRERDPEAPFYNGQQFSVLEVEDAHRVLGAAIKTLRENFDARKPAEIKLAAESVKKVASQIATLSGITAEKFATHLNRRPRS